MTSRVLVTGAAGRMGGHVRRAVAAASTTSLGAALEAPGHRGLGTEIEAGIKLDAEVAAAVAACDVAIDFSAPAASLALLDAAVPAGLPVVIATTGFDAAGESAISAAAERIAIVRAANFSLGITVLLELVAEAARRLDGYEVDILEMHHDQKVDAPSGTALALGEAVAAARGQKLAEVAVYHREGQTGTRDPRAIGMQSLRLGDSVGEHTIYLAGAGERLEFAHKALSRDNFAAGAVRAASWVVDQPPGLYAMRDVLDA